MTSSQLSSLLKNLGLDESDMSDKSQADRLRLGVDHWKQINVSNVPNNNKQLLPTKGKSQHSMSQN